MLEMNMVTSGYLAEFLVLMIYATTTQSQSPKMKFA